MMRVTLTALAVSLLYSQQAYACHGLFRIDCDIGKTAHDVGMTINKAAQDVGHTVQKAVKDAREAQDSNEVLIPVREFLKATQIPPEDAGAYGLLALQAKPTPSSKAKLMMVCDSFLAHFPPNSMVPRSIPMSDRMVTVWPVDNPKLLHEPNADCKIALEHYDLFAAESAIADAERQHATFDGEGPYLIGWSPSAARGKPDKLVIVVDLSRANDEDAIDHEFLFWKQKIVENPALWRSGFSVEGVREAIKDFADHYGKDMLDAVKLVKGE